MCYANKKLNSQQIRNIAIALLECECIKTDEKFNVILRQLQGEYHQIIIKYADKITMIYELIPLCQNHQGALEKLIEIMELLYEGIEHQASLPMQNLKQCLQEIFSPPPPPHASLKIEADGKLIIVISGRTISIPPVFDNSDTINVTVEPYTWKQLHTYSEQLLNKYMDIYEYIVNASKIDEVRELHPRLKQFRDSYCKSFVNDLAQLNPNLFSLPQIDVLRFMPQYIDAVLETLQEPLNNAYLQQGQKLVRRIKDILFAALSIADRALENYLSPINN